MRAAEILQVNPAQCVVVEDSEVGIAAGLGAGMLVLALDRDVGLPQKREGATWVAKDLADFDFEKAFS